jgi:hypothetical protein
MLDEVQDALGRLGIEDDLVAAGLFFPRGHSGGAFVGGLVELEGQRLPGFHVSEVIDALGS